MTSTTHNSEGVDQRALADAIEHWLGSRPGRTATQLADAAGVHARGIWQIRNYQRPLVSLDWADRLTLAMNVPLGEVAPARDDSTSDCGGARRGKRLDRHVRCISAKDLKLAYDLHWRGVPLNRIARTWQQSGRISYKSPEAASSSMWSLFKARGWLRRDRIEMVRAASTKHGRAGRAQARAYGPDYVAYRREQRKRSGSLRDVRCQATNTRGEPCRRYALAGRIQCAAHDPKRSAQRQQHREAAWAASRARMLRWGDHRSEIERTIAEHGRPALCRASGICTTVLGKMLGYDDGQPFKPETWSKLQHGIAMCDQTSRLSGGDSTARTPLVKRQSHPTAAERLTDREPHRARSTVWSNAAHAQSRCDDRGLRSRERVRRRVAASFAQPADGVRGSGIAPSCRRTSIRRCTHRHRRC
jgi:hypothetical protein